jgi:hypothetical protein
MPTRLQTVTLFALYQFTLLAGIMLFPVAVMTEQFGLRLPIDNVVDGLNEAYEQSRA